MLTHFILRTTHFTAEKTEAQRSALGQTPQVQWWEGRTGFKARQSSGLSLEEGQTFLNAAHVVYLMAKGGKLNKFRGQRGQSGKVSWIGGKLGDLVIPPPFQLE